MDSFKNLSLKKEDLRDKIYQEQKNNSNKIIF